MADGRHLGLGLGLVIVSFTMGPWRLWSAVTLGAGVLVLAYALVRGLHLVQHEAPARAHPVASDLPFDDRIRIVRRGVWLMPLILVPLSGWTVWNLVRFDSGQVSEIYLWGVIGDIYRYYGFWPAVLVTPVGTVLLELLLISGLQKLKRESREQFERGAL